MKKLSIILFTLLISLAVILSLTACGEDDTKTITLNVYNWGDYISTGEMDEDGNPGYDTNEEFAKYFNENLSEKYADIYGGNVKIKISYSTYPTNEDMYSNLSSGAGDGVYDVIIPSDYMLQRMADEGMLHSFSGSKETAEELLALGWYISISGVVTFKNAVKMLDVVNVVPNDKFLIETDSPYLSPVPNRGKVNNSSNLWYTAGKIAEIKGISVEEVCEMTCKNACKLFGI